MKMQIDLQQVDVASHYWLGFPGSLVLWLKNKIHFKKMQLVFYCVADIFFIKRFCYLLPVTGYQLVSETRQLFFINQ